MHIFAPTCSLYTAALSRFTLHACSTTLPPPKKKKRYRQRAFRYTGSAPPFSSPPHPTSLFTTHNPRLVMLRRVATVYALRSRAGVTALAVSGGLSANASAFTCQASPLQQMRWASSDAAAPTATNVQRNNNTTSPVQSQRGRRDALPPAFDIVHWNDENTSAGHLLRVVHRDGFIVLDYHRQRASTAEVREDGTRAANPNRAEKVVTVTLPPVYVARFLGVLEGRMNKLEVQSRFTNASFLPNAAKGKHHYTLHCTSMKPTTGQIQTVDGADVQEETVEWTVEFNAAESLMFHRFLTQALHYNTGFSRKV
ncbi:hypothetical protein JKF63_06935 [Porcisia hertigi]|uniref:SUN domain-containing protein n=1 Tax=Porcisia hertigi TaxID=2761500 RepID=A0A836LJE0_9TRYP|nr:hypothetical protein JKF63_06935 [Porcisia hertigi]